MSKCPFCCCVEEGVISSIQCTFSGLCIIFYTSFIFPFINLFSETVLVFSVSTWKSLRAFIIFTTHLWTLSISAVSFLRFSDQAEPSCNEVEQLHSGTQGVNSSCWAQLTLPLPPGRKCRGGAGNIRAGTCWSVEGRLGKESDVFPRELSHPWSQ